MEGSTTLTSIINTVTSVAGGVFEWAGDAVDFIVGEPLLLVGVSLPLIYGAIRLVRRLVR